MAFFSVSRFVEALFVSFKRWVRTEVGQRKTPCPKAGGFDSNDMRLLPLHKEEQGRGCHCFLG
jgi:hypothetical protein